MCWHLILLYRKGKRLWISEPQKLAADSIAGWRRPTVPKKVFQVGSVEMPTKGPKVLTLKQRLVALTQAPSSPTSSVEPSPKSPTTKRKFIPPWVKRTNPQNGHHDEFIGEDRLQLLISKLIYQAGVDYECVLPSYGGALGS